MRHLRVLICGSDDLTSDLLTELAAVDLPLPDLPALQPAAALDDLEATVLTTGHAIMRRLFHAAWEALDAALVAAYRRQHAAAGVTADGHEALTVASRVGTLRLARQVLRRGDTGAHVLPANAVLPEHGGIILTRGLQEWACLLPQDLPFASVARLLGWQAQEAEVLSATTVRTLVRRHGQLIRHAEHAEAAALLARDDPAALTPVLAPPGLPRRRAGWPPELNAAVEAALAAGQACPPVGVGWADWERVLTARRAEAERPIEELRTLGPTLAPGEVLLTVDEVLTRKPAPHHFWEVRTARLVSRAGARYVTGVGEAFLDVVDAAVRLAVGSDGPLLAICDGARWIRAFLAERLADLPQTTRLLDWHHLAAKCREFGGRLCQGREAKRHFARRLLRCLWAGKVAAAIALLERYRRHATDSGRLEELIGYLEARRAWIPDYRQRRRDRRYIGSGQVEQANDLLVARRQKRGGMQWSLATSDGLAALRTLLLNGGWERYWADGEVLPLAEARAA